MVAWVLLLCVAASADHGFDIPHCRWVAEYSQFDACYRDAALQTKIGSVYGVCKREGK